eukprot:NODE_2811_length_862_cov_73.932349_g2323_i0.p1 GENE.NODE_2811_length_862_cov_73.932349_g2323_i0~~NODE_2811_length_862_cov_73.932349_g2323_i0.p1  ORF type:complete len:248 (+),score=49.75 NODE_2811_length_862_cov_73.932349_g2323_i0:112-855(+)
MTKGGPTWLEDLKSSTTSNITFQQVTLQYPGYLTPWKKVKIGCPGYTYPRALNYAHMLHFFSLTWFRSPVLREYDYVWRLDGDLQLTRPVRCDVFEVMKASRALLGFYKWKPAKDATQKCSGPVHKITEAYARAHNFQPTHLQHIGYPGPTRYCAGWLVFKWSFWTSPDVLEFAEHVAKEGLAYYWRLGEQTLYAHMAALFAPASTLHQFGDLGPFIHKNRFTIWPGPEERRPPFYARDPLCARLST